MSKKIAFIAMAAMVAANATPQAIDLSVLDNLQFSTSAASDARRLELREEGTVGHALVSGTEYKGDPNGGAATAWDTSSLATGWQTLTSGTNEAAVLKFDPSSVAVEGGRLAANTTWSNAKTHVVRNWVVVPDGVTLTISQGAIVKFCESAGIKVLSGGKVQVNGAEGADVFFASIGNDTYGGDTNMRDGDFETNSYEIVTLNGGTWSDNGYWVTPDAQLRGYPEVTLHDSLASVSDGVARVPVTVEGTRNAPFSIDWQITGSPFSTTSGTLTWSQSSEGTKFIEIPLKSNYTPNSTETFALSATRARSVNLANDAARVSVYSGHIAIGDIIENGESNLSDGTEIETRGIGGTMIAKALENITYSPRWSGAAECSVAINGERLISTAEEGAATWTRPAEPGLYTFTHKAGSETLTARFAVLGDDVEVHRGALDTNQTDVVWRKEQVHLIVEPVTVPLGVVLTIESGAVVKFMPGTSLTVPRVSPTSPYMCQLSGAIFTHAYDDTVGGDTLMDGNETVPVMGDYSLHGIFPNDGVTEYRYRASQTLPTSVTADTCLAGYSVYIASNSVTVASGATLTLQPGTVIKFNTGCSFTVNGTLDAQGTRAAPIVFTSFMDDEHGGDANGDGDKTYPYAGDWHQITGYGTVKLNHCKLLWCSAKNNEGAIYPRGGTWQFNNSIVAHCEYDCVRTSGGTFEAANSVFMDSSMGAAPSSGTARFINCVFNNLTTAVRWGNGTFYNCVFSDVFEDILDTKFYSSTIACQFGNCVFYNPEGTGDHASAKVGQNGNIWGDPMFVDAENGDFRTQKGSVCINAGDAAYAPEFDYFGQPRDGAPDIGIYESVGVLINANDLATVAVDVPAASSSVGDTLTVSYSVANAGKQVVNGSWRDKISLVSVDGGYSIDLGTVVQTAAIAVGATNTFNASLTVPTDAEGTWRVAVNVNTERDIYEGANITNNTATSTESLAISLPAREAADGFSGTATKGAPASAKFALDGTEPMVARINAPAGTIVYLGSGFMPSASSYSARAVVGADGGLIGIPSGVTTAYILVETTSSKGAAFTMTLESAALAVQSVSPATLPYTGTTGLVIDGANFAEGCRVELGAAQFAATVVSPTRLTAQIDCSRLTAGATYSVMVIGTDGATATLPNVLTVAKVPAAPKLSATLDAPASVRRGRTLTVYIDYENVGNADLPAPIFELISEGQVFKIDGACYTNSVKVMGLSAEAPVGTLRPGEPQRIGIPVTILAENVKWKLKSYHAAQVGAKAAKFSLRELYDDDWVLYHVADDDATVAKLRTAIGSTYADYYTNLGAWLGMAKPQTMDYETLKAAFGRYQYLKAAGMLDAGDEDGSKSPAETAESAEAGGTRSVASTGVTLFGAGEQRKSLCHHVKTNPDIGICTDGIPGSIWKWCGTCQHWFMLFDTEQSTTKPNVFYWLPLFGSENGFSDDFDESRETFVICHGNANSINHDWVKNMADSILYRKTANKCNVLAINWGQGAYVGGRIIVPNDPKESAKNIPFVVDRAIEQLEILGLDSLNTTLIGHSHGAHVCANIATRSATQFPNGFKRFIGLDTSTTDVGTHDKNVYRPADWIAAIRQRTKIAEFYKSSFDDSLEFANQLYGDYNFLVFREHDLFEYWNGGAEIFDARETERHGVSHQWFINTLWSEDRYANLGFNFEGDKSWKALAGDVTNPRQSDFAGIICDNRVEMLCPLRTESNADNWNYKDTVLSKDRWGMNRAARWFRKNLTRTIDYQVSMDALPKMNVGGSEVEFAASGNEIEFKVRNNADNLTVDYHDPNDGPYGAGDAAPWKNNLAHGVWLIDYESLSASAKAVADAAIAANSGVISADVLKDLVADRANVRIVGDSDVIAPSSLVKWSDTRFTYPQSNDTVRVKVNFKNAIFGEDRPLVAETDENGEPTRYRDCLLLIGVGMDEKKAETAPESYKWDINADDNFLIRKIAAMPKEVRAVISKLASAKKSAALRSARLLAAPPTHQLSANALKPGEVVQVKADKNGNWSIDLDASESYTTDDEEDITVNRFELIDTADKKGTVAMRKTDFGSGTDYQQIDFPWVTVHGQLPVTTNADGNPVCEGERYVVQLTVFATGEEEDVTTCVIDVRAPEEEDPGEDEDAGGSNEPKSCDPNEMVGDEGVGEARYVRPGQELTYTIYFENKTNATAAAACVEVFNPLNEWLDWSSLTMLDVGYNNNVDNGLGGKHEGVSEKAMDGTNVSVRTEFAVAYYDEEGNVLDENALAARSTMEGVSARAEWYLRIIDPNGDSEGWPLDMTGGFLPPNNEETHCGEGYIRYKVKVRDDAPGNVVITNSATIIFDKFNDPIETDPAWWNTVGASSTGVEFVDSEIVVNEGENAVVRITGSGAATGLGSVSVYLTYNTATSADLNLGGILGTDTTGRLFGGKKFPVAFDWGVGESGENVLVIPIKADKTVEGDEFFTLQLANPQRQELGERRVCTVTIHDPDYDALAAKIATGMASKAEKTAWDKLQKAKAPYIRGLADPADGGKVTGSGLCAAGKKVTLKAKANKNFTFLGWRQGTGNGEWGTGNGYVATTPSLVIDRSAKPTASSKTSTTITEVDGDATYFAVFKSDPTVMVSVVASDGKGDAPTGKGVGKYVAGTITGEGKYAPGKKVTLKATANKGYVFAGWEKTGDGDVSQVASIAFVMPSNDVGHVARFVTLAEDVEYEVGLSLGDEWADGGSFVDATLRCGIAVNWPIKVDALSETTVKVAGLPAGLKFVQDKDTKEYRVEGVPSAASKVDKKGVVMPSEVKFVVTTAGKSMRTFSKNVVVRPLPAWAYGTFSGVLSSVSPVPGERPPSHGAVSMTVSAVGKISGKIDLGGTNYSFSVNGYAGRSEVVDDDSDAALFVDAVAASGKAFIPLLLEGRRDDVRLSAERAAVTNAMFSGTDVGGYDVELWRELWKDSDNAAVLSEWAGAYTYVTANGDSLALTVDEKGGVKVAGTLGEKRKVSLSAVLHPYFADVYVAPTKTDAEFFERIMLVNRHGDADHGCGVAYRDAGVFASSASFDGAGSGTVTMNPKYGQAAAGKTVTLAAKPAKDSVFVKWVYVNGDGDEISDYSPTLKLVAGGCDIPVTALFAAKENITKPEPHAATSPDGGIDMWTHAVVGVAFEGAVLVDDTARPVSFTAKNLPAGLKIDKTTGVITGRPTKPFDGMVSVTATSGANGKVSGTVEIPMKVHAIPERLRGAFSGFTTDFSKETGNPGWIGLVRGLFTATVADNGSIAVNMTTGFGAVSFKAAGWDDVDWDGDRIVCAYATMTGGKGEKLNLLILNGINWDGRDLDGRVSGGIFGKTELSVLGDRNEFAKVGGKYAHENMSWFADELVGTWDFYVNDWVETWPEVGEPTEEGLVYPYSHNLSTTGKEGASPSVRIVVKDDGTVAVSGEFLGEKISGTIPVIVERCNDESDVYMVHFWQKMKDGKECYISFVLCSGRESGHVSVSGEAWLRDFK